MEFRYVNESHWPPLAWLARCRPDTDVVTVHHGNWVETRAEWFCEAAWDGPFDEGGFDETDIITGSGGRIRDDNVVFVSSGSTVDRLQSFETAEAFWVSNSLPCLLNNLDASVDPAYPNYYEDFHSITQGIHRYHRRIATSRGDISLTYFENLVWSGAGFTLVPKHERNPDLRSFLAYRDFLRASMNRLATNARNSRRDRPFKLLTTLSTGYDSTTVTVLARDAGCKRVLCFDRDHEGDADSGADVGVLLGLEPIAARDSEWRNFNRPEVAFLAANGMAEEVRFKAVEEVLAGQLLLTGYHGDKLWGRDTTSVGPDIVRGDPSGLGLTEFRLWAGFLHCPPAFWGVRKIAQVVALSQSTDLQPWDIGGEYSRPICRRICEEAGVPRQSFGVKKKKASVLLHNRDEFLTPESRSDYMRWLREHRSSWWKRGRVPPIPSVWLDLAARSSARHLAAFLRRTPFLWRLAASFDSGPSRFRRFVFPWAIERAKNRYRAEP